ncbi:Long-chain-fatty-acid--CoA ligase (EC [Olavius algarvensis Delta 1 endosymbiont]|nr:Long-chain-fatty-acid--CoA ligase (EC [Olavius algarvensis Delta 1 endosymbiont]
MNLSLLLTKTARKLPDKTAFVHGVKQLTYAQLNARANRMANVLNQLGIRAGDNVAILQYNVPEFYETLFACFKLGCGAVPINFRLHPKEFAFIIAHSQAKAVIFSEEFNAAIMEVRDDIPGANHLITLGGGDRELLDYEGLIGDASDEMTDADVAPNDLAWLFYTSGTTGMPKGAMLTHRNLLAMAMNFYADICPGFGPDDVILHAAPLSHGSGLFGLANIGKGALNVILESKSFDPELVFETIAKYRVTNMFAAPAMVKMMIDHPAVQENDHNCLRSIVYGGAPMLVEDLKEAVQKLGPCLVQLYGQGESPMTITYLPHQDHVFEGSAAREKRLASAGIPRTDVEVKIFDKEDNELPPGKIGNIVTRSDLVMKGYWRNPDATAATIRNGWLDTGDMGYLDDNGYLFIMDRSKDMIISGGENIYPREIEEVLIKHPAVREVSVIGVPDAKWGEAIKAVVALVPGRSATEQELIAFCKENIASYKKPKSVDFVEELPKNNYGKILKRELRAGYWEGQERKV